MPAAPPPTPVSHGLTSPRYPGGLEGMAAPSHRYTGAHLRTSFSTQHYGMVLPVPCWYAAWQRLLGCVVENLCQLGRLPPQSLC